MEALLSIEDQVKFFVAETSCAIPHKVRPETNLLGDLGLDGDDADKFLAEFASRFEVDMTGFVFREHFGPEGMYPWHLPRFVSNLMRAIRGDDPHKIAGLKPVRVADLIAAAETKKWLTVGQ